MATQVRILVEEDYVGDIYVKDNPREYWQKYVDAVQQNPTLVLINKNNTTIPVEGMIYQNKTFISSNANENFIINNISPDFERFALIVNNVYVASHDVSVSTMPNVIAAYQSNPRFEISTALVVPEKFNG